MMMMAPSVWLSALCLLAASNFALSNAAVSNRTVKVTTVLSEPFARYKSLTSLPRQLDGYIIDLLDELSKTVTTVNLHFDVTPVPDGKYGNVASGKWSGMMGEITGTRPRKDMAAAPLTKTTLRESAVTFIDPAFMIFDLAILMDKRDKSSDIRSIVDLVKQDKIKYGVVHGGSTADYIAFMGHSDTDYRSLMSIMTEQNNLLASVDEGVRRVRRSTRSQPFVFIGEKQMMEYHASRRPCDLTTVHGSDHAGEYHLAVRKNIDAQIKEKLAEGLNKLNQTGRLTQLYDRWWTYSSQCSSQSPAASTSVAVVTAVFLSVLSIILSRGQ